MPERRSFWFRIGYAAERALARVGSAERGQGRDKPRKAAGVPRPVRSDASGDALVRVAAAGVGAVAARVLGLGSAGRSPGWISLVRAGAAGAAAALVVEFARPVLADEVPRSRRALSDELLAGAGAGLVYATLIEPTVPGPLLLRGAVYATAEYLTADWGGLGEVLKPLTPQERVPVLGDVLADGASGGRSYLEHLAFAVALAELYGEGRDGA